jgi:SAM-dependent methyltransferase
MPSASQLSASYADPRLAALYDALNPPDAAAAFYLSLPGTPPARILDMGCGTGQLACELAARGHDVTGADPAAAMLALARARPGGGRVRWIQADAASLATEPRFDLIIMTGHVFQLLLEDDEVRAALRALARHLAPGGRIAFETRNPAVREWQDWNPRDTRQRVQAAGLVADVHYDISAVAGELVTYETWFRFAGLGAVGAGPGPGPGTRADGAGDAEDRTVVVPDTLRFMDQAEVAAFIAEAGLTRVTWYGDWDGSPCGPASPEIIAIAAGDRAASGAADD